MTDRRSRIISTFGAVAVALASAAASVSAQFPRGADTLSPKAVSESLVVLKTLDARVRSHPKDAAAWYRRGMVAWALQLRDASKPPMSNLDGTRLGRLADTSLRIAKELAPDSTRYFVASGQYLLNSGWGITRMASKWMYQSGITAARKTLDSTEHAEWAIEMGRVHWRRYDARANRQLELDPGAAPRSLSEAVAPLVRAVDALYGAAGLGTGTPGASLADRSSPPPTTTSNGIATFSSFNDVGLSSNRPDLDAGAPQLAFKDAMETFNRLTKSLPPDVQGESDYYQAEALFREAYDVAPTHERTLRNLVMVYVEKNRWAELATIARGHLKIAPWDPMGWMALGLATHRLGDDHMSAIAFDSAMTYLSPTERQRLDQLERILPPKDSARVSLMNDTDRAAYQRLYWVTADPLWSQGHGSPRLEYLARVAYSEFRWSVEELKVHGADSDRGNVHIRYGPPDKIMTIAPDMNHQITDVTTVWTYKSGLMFIFVGPPTWATARFPFNDRAMVAMLTESQPIRWDNISAVQVDSMPFQAARFRATGDSVDVVVAALPPVAAIRRASELSDPVNTYIWWLGGGTVALPRDSVIAKDRETSVFTRRVAGGTYLMRTEASTHGSLRAGSASAVVVAGTDTTTGFTTSGFGISDVLIATKVGTPMDAPRRWSDLHAAPLAGATSRSAPITLVWETYGLTPQNNEVRDSLHISVERVRGNSGRVVAEIVGRLASAVGVDRRDDRVVMSFGRSRPASSTIAEQLNLSLAGTPAGIYRVTVTVKDLITGRTTSRTSRLILDE